MTFVVYVLKCGNGNLYIGYTQNLEDRLRRHRANYERATRHKGPFAVAYTETYETRSAAMKREKELKSGQGRAWLKTQLHNGA